MRYSQPCSHPTIKNSLIGRPAQDRDNTVIFNVRTWNRRRNPPNVAGLPRLPRSTKVELSAHTQALDERRRRPACRFCEASMWRSHRRDWTHPLRLRGLGGRRVFRTLVDDLVDQTECLGVLGGEELVALERVLDRLVGLAGVLHVDL